MKGSHIVVRKLFDHDSAYIFQNADRRIVFAIPYERDYTLIGTTDVDFAGDLSRSGFQRRRSTICAERRTTTLSNAIDASDVVWGYSGVRSLHDDGKTPPQDATRDFVLALDGRQGEPPLLSIVGGKITTYRHVAEEALRKLAVSRSARPGHAARRCRAAISLDGREGWLAIWREVSVLGAATQRLAATYGTMAGTFSRAPSRPDLGTHFGPASTSARWSTSSPRVGHHGRRFLWRRTKLGLRMSDAERGRLSEWLAARATAAASSAA